MSNARQKLKKANAKVQEQRRLERHEKRFGPGRGALRAEKREQNYYRRRKGWEIRRDPRLGDQGLFMLLSRCKSKFWGPAKGPSANNAVPYWYRDGRRVTA